MPPLGIRTGALAGSALARNRLISQRMEPSAGVLRDQQTLHERTGTHGHLLLDGLMIAGDAFEGVLNPRISEHPHTTAVWSLER